jgi:hypothetical protein
LTLVPFSIGPPPPPPPPPLQGQLTRMAFYLTAQHRLSRCQLKFHFCFVLIVLLKNFNFFYGFRLFYSVNIKYIFLKN